MRHNEDQLQKACIRWFDYVHRDIRLLLHHSPNGGHRNAAEAAKFKEMGVRAGFPDLILLLPSNNGRYAFLCIELKTEKGRQTDLQKEYENMINTHTAGKYVVCRSLDEFIKIVTDYLYNEDE